MKLETLGAKLAIAEAKLAARREERAKMMAVVGEWARQRGVDVQELMFRMRTAPLMRPADEEKP